jgi:hypothetical protein
MSLNLADDDLKAIEKALGDLIPAPSRLDRDKLMFQAGANSARLSSRRRWILPAAAAALSALAAALLVLASNHLLKRQYDSDQERSIDRLLASSRLHEAEGRRGDALIDLDAALQLAAQTGPSSISRHQAEQQRRHDLARREAAEVLARLSRQDPASFSLGQWLNLRSRASKDPDLEPLHLAIAAQYDKVLQRQVDFHLAAGRRAYDSRNAVAALAHCDQIDTLIQHVAQPTQPTARRETERLVTQIVSTHGVSIEPPQGKFVFGARSYVADMVPVLATALERKGYLPNRQSSPRFGLWLHAAYRVHLDVSEQQEGNYLSSENRLTRIEATVTLSSADGALIWQTTLTARSVVPVPRLPAVLANRIANSTERSEAFDRHLSESARDQFDEKFSFALTNLPECPASAAAL